MNAQDALELGTQQGERVNLVSNNGVMSGVRVHLFDLPRGCIAAYYPEANVLTGREADPRSHTPAFKSVEVTIEVIR